MTYAFTNTPCSMYHRYIKVLVQQIIQINAFDYRTTHIKSCREHKNFMCSKSVFNVKYEFSVKSYVGV